MPAGQIDKECAPAQAGLVKHLKQWIAKDEDLLTTADHLVLVVARMSARLAPADETVRPGRAEDLPAARLLLPLADHIGAGDYCVFPRRGLEPDGALPGTVCFHRDGLAVNASVNLNDVAGSSLGRGLRDRAHLQVRRQTGQRFWSNVPGPGRLQRGGVNQRQTRRLGLACKAVRGASGQDEGEGHRDRDFQIDHEEHLRLSL